MEGTYELRFGEKRIGTVCVRREGLYYALLCRCPKLSRGMFELLAGEENLGLLVPLHGVMGLECRIAAKRLGEGRLSFSLRERNTDCVEIHAEEPFAYLQRLHDAYLVKKGEKTMIAFREGNTAE